MLEEKEQLVESASSCGKHAYILLFVGGIIWRYLLLFFFLGGFIGVLLMACLISGKMEDLYYQRREVYEENIVTEDKTSRKASIIK